MRTAVNIFTIVNIWMATASLEGGWHQTANATSAHYRSLTAHLGNGLPDLARGDADVIRIRRGGKPRRKANGMGKEFSGTVGPVDQPNSLADGIRAVGTALVVKWPDAGMSIPDVAMYLYIQRLQEWRSLPDHHHVRGNCDAPALEGPPNPPTPRHSRFTLRVPPGNVTSVHASTRTWAGRDSGMGEFSSRSSLGVSAYGIPTGAGVSSRRVRNRRGVVAAPITPPPRFASSGIGTRVRPILSQSLRNRPAKTRRRYGK